MECSVLGPLEVRAGGRAVALGGAKPRGLLALRASSMLHEALALWRGPPLGDLGSLPFAPPEVARLEEQRLEALMAIVRAMGIVVLDGETAEDAVVRFLAGRNLLLVADNCEHLLGIAPFISRVLEACPHVTMLATSREPLSLQAEERRPVPPLPGADAEELFAERIAGARTGCLRGGRRRHDRLEPRAALGRGEAAAREELERAARLYGAAGAHRHGQPSYPVEERMRQLIFEPAQRRLGEDEWDTGVRDGAAMSHDDAVGYALAG